MALTANQICVNLPVKDLEKTKAFFSTLGFAFNEQFTNDKAACLVISDHIFVMLLLEEFFQSFTKKEIPNTTQSAEAILAITADNRQQVDEIVERAYAAGATTYMETADHGFMYERGFQDVDGHHWSVFYMDPNFG